MSTIEQLIEICKREGYTGKEAVEEAKAELKERRQHELELARSK
jgi:hypothetical protein